MNKKTVIAIIALLIIGGIVAVISIYNKPHRDVMDEEVGATLSAQELFSSFENNLAEANKKYVENVVEVTGEVVEISSNDDGTTTIILGTSDPIFGIKAVLLKSEESIPEKGNEVTLRGIVSGFNSDVEIVRAVIV